ncbi:MAG: T9SS type A sorting domain-containing protein [Candidatus Fermentibacteraceae bacterium]|nr:T9SS type A sorting domain-containing protein [Candidatus Fermentibacteraceae bacterium]
MYRRILPVIIIGSLVVAYADSEVQTDWSGGSGVWGPVIHWDDEFYSGSGINAVCSPNSLILGRDALTTPIEYFVDPSINCSSVYSMDMDGDGDMDILAGDMSFGEIIWWDNTDGSGTSWIRHTVASTNANSVYSDDINGDGSMDVLGVNRNIDSVSWWENADSSGTFWIEHTIDENFGDPMGVYSEDIDNDGDLDVLCGSFLNHDEMSWWENLNGLGTSWTKHAIGGNRSISVYSEDIDGDGDMDILSARWGGPTALSWWENVDGIGTVWFEHWFTTMAYTSFAVDIDGDGDMDILDNDIHSSEIKWLENMDGSGTSWATHFIADFCNGPWGAYAADLDGDGDIDVLSGASYVGDVSWWENIDGSGTEWFEHLVDEDFYSMSFYTEDINGDGYNDFLSVGNSGVCWWDITEYSLCGELNSSSLYLLNDPGWGYIDWTAEEPASTSVSFQVRSCDSPDSTGMGVWSDTLYSPCSLLGILDEGDSYFQYRAILQTSDSSITPVLEDITVTWSPLGTGGGDPVVLELLPFAPNPSVSPVIRFSLPEPASVEISIFDLSGRLVSEVRGDEYSSGFHDVLLKDFLPGVYFCRMTSGNFTATQSFVVIE